MPAISPREAIERLTSAVRDMSADDLLEFYNELFPEAPKSEVTPKDSGATDRKKILEQLDRGLEVEEILDLWNVTFPEAWNVVYDDESETIQYNEESEALR